MKKSLLTVLLFFTITIAFSQHRVGLKFSPTVSFNRLDNDNYGSNDIGLRFILGPTFDYFLGENYYISTGLFYAPKRVGVSYLGGSAPPVSERYNLQYLQIPATIKLYTNELALDTRLYFQLGGLVELKINERAVEAPALLIEKFRPYDFSTVIGTGVEYRIGVNTVLYGGLSYVRGLLNVASQQSPSYPGFLLKNDLIAIDLGIMF